MDEVPLVTSDPACLNSTRLMLWALAVLVVMVWLAAPALVTGMAPAPWYGDGSLAPLLLFMVALGCEYVDSSLGMGYGTTLTPVLMLAGFAPLAIVPAILLSECLSGFSAAVLHHRAGNVDLLRDTVARRTAVLLSSLSALGAVAAVVLAISIPRGLLAPLIAGIIIAVGVLIIATRRRQLHFRPWHIVTVGAVAAFNKGLSGGGYGPLVTGGQVVSGVSAKSAVAITSLAEGVTCCVGLVAYVVLEGSLNWPLVVPLALGAVMSVPVATVTVRHLSEASLRSAVGIVTLLLGIVALAKVLLGS